MRVHSCAGRCDEKKGLSELGSSKLSPPSRSAAAEGERTPSRRVPPLPRARAPAKRRPKAHISHRYCYRGRSAAANARLQPVPPLFWARPVHSTSPSAWRPLPPQKLPLEAPFGHVESGVGGVHNQEKMNLCSMNRSRRDLSGHVIAVEKFKRF